MASTSKKLNRNETASQPDIDVTAVVREEQVKSLKKKYHFRYWKMTLPFLLVLSTVAVYADGLNGEFIFDDKPAIVDNPEIQNFGAIFNRLGNQEARPVVFASLALNYALGELDPVGYHLFNLLIHILAMLTIWAIVRTTLSLPKLRTRFEQASYGSAFAIALIWSVHPLQTECVSYVFQRSESMQALFYLVAFYSYIRSALSRGTRRAWWIASLLTASALGMGCKATFITLPAILLLYDGIFLRRTYPETARQRRYVILSIVLVVVVVGVSTVDIHEMAAGYGKTTPPEDVEFSVGYATNPIEYIRSQPTVILNYLKLAFWPDRLCLDYRMPPIDNVPQIAITSSVLLVLLLLTGIALRRIPMLGFCPAFVFLVLSPTAFYWKMELMFTYRMYLPLAGLVSFAVSVYYLLLERLVHAKRLTRPVIMSIGTAGLILVTGAMSARTILRNRDFQNQYTMYRSVVDTRPENPRGQYNLANRLIEQYKSLKQKGRDREADATLKEAVLHYKEAIRYFPKYIEAHINLAIAYGLDGRTDDLIEQLKNAVSWDPNHLTAQFNLAQGYRNRGIAAQRSGHRSAAERDFKAAVVHYEKFLAAKPTYLGAVFNLGTTLYFLGRYSEAAMTFEKYLRQIPKSPDALRFLGESLFELRRYSDAEKVIRRYLRLKPTSYWGKDCLRRIAEAAKS